MTIARSHRWPWLLADYPVATVHVTCPSTIVPFLRLAALDTKTAAIP